jgi:hypothetical protein
VKRRGTVFSDSYADAIAVASQQVRKILFPVELYDWENRAILPNLDAFSARLDEICRGPARKQSPNLLDPAGRSCGDSGTGTATQIETPATASRGAAIPRDR